MKQIAAFLVLILLPIDPTFASTIYTFDPTHTYAQWTVNHMGFSNLSGKWLANGTLTLDEETPENSTVTMTIKTAELVTGIPKLDEHLTDVDFFDVKKYPTATFVSKKITMLEKNKAKIEGILTIKNSSKPVFLEITLNKKGINPLSQKPSVGFSGTMQIKRSDFGVDKYVPNVGDEVSLTLEAEAYQADS